MCAATFEATSNTSSRKLPGHCIALSTCDVYNLLPEYIIQAADVSEFQKRMQEMCKSAAGSNFREWRDLYSPRVLTHAHPLREWMDWAPAKCERELATTIRNVNNEACANWLRFQSGTSF